MKRSNLRKRNYKRLKKLKARQFGGKAVVIRMLDCAACGEKPTEEKPSHAAHVVSRGAGGTSKDLIPLCHICHERQHKWGIKTFADAYKLDLKALAMKYEKIWQDWQKARVDTEDTRALEF